MTATASKSYPLLRAIANHAGIGGWCMQPKKPMGLTVCRSTHVAFGYYIHLESRHVVLYFHYQHYPRILGAVLVVLSFSGHSYWLLLVAVSIHVGFVIATSAS